MSSLQVFKRYVEIGRVAFVSFGPHEGKLVAIVDVIDQNRVSTLYNFHPVLQLHLISNGKTKWQYVQCAECSTLVLSGLGGWTMHRGEEAVYALQVHAAY